MVKKERMLQVIVPLMKEYMSVSKAEIARDIEQNRMKYKESLHQICNELFLSCIQKQQDDQLGKIRYAHFFILRSALYTGKYEVQIQLFDQQQYMGKTEAYHLWDTTFIMRYFKRDMEKLQEIAKKEIIQYSYQEQRRMMLRYYPQYLELIRGYLVSEIASIIQLKSFEDMDKEDGLEIIYGGYMEQGEINVSKNGKVIHGRRCCPDVIDKWQNSHGNALTMDSYLICACGGCIEPVTSGQEFTDACQGGR